MLKGGHNSLEDAHFCKMMNLAVLTALAPSGQMLQVKCKFINYLTNKYNISYSF
jgi:hypothetical protein